MLEKGAGFIYVKRKRAACGENRYTVAVVQVTRAMMLYINGPINFIEALSPGIHRVTVQMLL